jgi:FtsP/CotA-like multicopper oxidase with cupredoxin domain
MSTRSATRRDHLLPRKRASRSAVRRAQVSAAAAGAALLLTALPAHAQYLPPADCIAPGQPLVPVPELAAQDRKLKGTILLADEQQQIAFGANCALQYVRYLRGIGAVTPPAMPGAPTPTPAPLAYPAPQPGPTLRARVGDLVQLTFLNQIDPNHFGDSIDRGENAGACDETSGSPGYPQAANDTFPDCFHGSSTGNIHFHGTHTNPNSTGDNVFLQLRPSPRQGGQPTVTGDSVKGAFDKFFADCEQQLRGNVLSEWPYVWSDLPSAYTDTQKTLLQAYDAGTAPYSPPAKPPAQKLWPPDEAAIAKGQWPQFFIGAYPYCYQIPEYKATTWPAMAAAGPAHTAMATSGPMPLPTLQMGQSPGTHWYHAHKHGSTTINVLNGMTGVFIIEGRYDDDLNRFYGTREVPDWTRRQPVLVINQIGVSPNMLGGSGTGGGGPALSVNGRLQPKLTMRPGEVQMWRIANTSSRSGFQLAGFQTASGQASGFQWKQLAQDGVQLADVNYQASQDPTLLLASGNRADLLVKAPLITGTQPQVFNVMVQPTVARTNLRPAVVLMSVEVSGTPVTGPQSEFIPKAPAFPPFLTDITDAEVKYTPKRTFTFDTKKAGQPMQHTINNEQFSDQVSASMLLNTAEEWTVANTTNGTTGQANIDHPFHIHINPFQVTEVFDPNQKVTVGGALVNKYVFGAVQDPSVQCSLNADKPETWTDCHNTQRHNLIWWDVFPIPAGRPATQSNGQTVIVPGFFKMRSRFVDFPGLFVMHCHILAHEDRGMMMTVEVRTRRSPVQHH